MSEPLPNALFQREDESPDGLFYSEARLVTHIDDATIAALTDYYRSFLPDGADVLDLMSSWVSHLPPEKALGRVAGLGMNADELRANARLTERVVHDLNRDPLLPFAAQQFDRAMIVVSVQYLTDPVAVFRDIGRVLRDGGRLLVAMSHRLFPTKAVRAFRELAPADRIRLVGEYFQRAQVFDDVHFEDRSPAAADPLWLVHGRRAPRDLLRPR